LPGRPELCRNPHDERSFRMRFRGCSVRSLARASWAGVLAGSAPLPGSRCRSYHAYHQSGRVRRHRPDSRVHHQPAPHPSSRPSSRSWPTPSGSMGSSAWPCCPVFQASQREQPTEAPLRIRNCRFGRPFPDQKKYRGLDLLPAGTSRSA
jgi:hypothetical protein